MPREMLVYRGWVGANEIDRIELEAMGVTINSAWNPAGTFDRVEMTSDVHAVFRRRWQGRYVWGLTARKQVVYTAAERAAERAKDDIDVPF